MIFRENAPERSDIARATRGQLHALHALIASVLILIVGSIAISNARDDVARGTDAFEFLRNATDALEVAILGVLVFLVVGVVIGLIRVVRGRSSAARGK